MAIIYSYPLIDNVNLLDELLITDVSDNRKTKTTTISKLKQGLNVVNSLNTFTGDLTINSGNGILISNSDPNITVSNTGVLSLAVNSPLAVDASTGDINLSIPNPLPTANGGTGFTSYITGDLLIGFPDGAGGSILSKIPIGSVGQVLKVAEVAGEEIPQWSTDNDSVTSVTASQGYRGAYVSPTTGDVKVGINLTGLTDISTGAVGSDILFITDDPAGTPINKKVSVSNLLTSQNVLTGSVNLGSEVSGVLPTANGGTGSSAITYCDLAANVTGTLPISNGGTGATSANTALNALLPDQTSANGQYLKSSGGNATWDAPSGSGTVTGSGGVASYTLFRGTTNIGDAPMVVDSATSPTVSTHTGNFINTGTFSNTGNFTIKGITTNIIPNGPGVSSPTLNLGASTTNNDPGPKIVLDVSGFAQPPQSTTGSYAIQPPTAMRPGDEGNRTWTLPVALGASAEVLTIKAVTTVGVNSNYELDWKTAPNIYDVDGALSGSREVDLGTTGTNTLWFSGAGDGNGTTVRFSPKVRIDNNLDMRGGQLHEHQNEIVSAEGGSIYLDFNYGNTQFITNQAGTTPNLSIQIPTNLKKGATYKIIITYNSVPTAFQMNSCFQFPGASSPGYTASTGKYDVYTCYCVEDSSGNEKLLCEEALGYE
tara:strand:+ start:911 stop:2875 length:1965 start_codon:yes stop_codon:yes gene_type:complete